MADAIKIWQGLALKKASTERDTHAWGLLGERYLQDHKDADALYDELRKKADGKAKSSDPIEEIGMDAVWLENGENYAAAKAKWEELSKKPDLPRRWLLLGRKQAATMNGKIAESKSTEAK